MSQTFKMFAAIKGDDDYRGPVCVNWYASSVRQDMGKMFHPDDPIAGWKKAMREGWRVRKVRVEVPARSC